MDDDAAATLEPPVEPGPEPILPKISDADGIAGGIAPPDPLESLRDVARGRVHLPGDDSFELASLPWNLAVRQRPSAVIEVTDVNDIVAVVRHARAHGLTVAAQPGGHGATPALDGSIVLRTRALTGISVDAEARVATVGAGAKWGELLGALDGTGLIALSGSNPDVSVIGLLLGGGVSWFGRRYGVAARSLQAVELVDGYGDVRRVTDDADRELMWALRGGGGEFGIVTRAEVSLYAEPELSGGKLMFPIADAPAVLAAFLGVTDSAPDGLTCWGSLVHYPDVPFLPEPLRGSSFVTVDLTWLGPADDAELLVAPLRSAGTVLSDTFGPLPIGRLGEVAAEPTDPSPGIEWGGALTGLDEATVATLLETVGDRERTALVSVQLRHLGGAFADPGMAPPAVSRALRGQYLALGLGIPMVPELVEPIHASLDALAGALSPVLTGATT